MSTIHVSCQILTPFEKKQKIQNISQYPLGCSAKVSKVIFSSLKNEVRRDSDPDAFSDLISAILQYNAIKSAGLELYEWDLVVYVSAWLV